MGVISDIYEGGGAKPVSWSEVGQTVEGEIVQIRTKQLPKFGTDIPETWPDGEPKMTPIVTVQTTESDDEDDDGKRDIYLRSNAYTAFGNALREAFKTKPTDEQLVGATIKLQFYATEKSGKGQPRKLFRARLTPKSVAAEAWDQPAAPPAKPAQTGGYGGSSSRPSALPPGQPSRIEDDIPF